ncbi:MAG: phage tail tape measure protein [Fibrobacter sp.]|nr:phage tail tape measure protein [Fibrobacter sp.]
MSTTSELTLRIGADPAKLQNGLSRSTKAVDNFATRAKASISRLGGAINGVADKLVTPFNSLLLGGGIGMAMKNVGDLSQSLMYYGMAAKKSDADTRAFRESLHNMAVQTGVDANTILAGISRIGEVTGDFDFSEQMGGNLAKAANASGASVEDLAAVAASLRVTMGLTADETQKFFNALIIQGDQGSFTLQKFAGEGKALLAATSTHGVKTPEQFARFGSYLQVMNAQIKSEAELTTSVSTLFSELSAKAKDLNKIGVHVFDKNNEFNDFDAIMRQLMQKTGGDIQKLQKFFGASSIKALQPLIGEYKKNWENIDNITQSGLAGMTNTAELDKRNEKISNGFNKSIEKMKAIAEQFADVNLVGPVDKLSDVLKYLSDHQSLVTAGFKAMTVAALALGAVKLGGLVNQVRAFGAEMKGLWTGKGAKGGSDAVGGAVSAAAVQKVFVVNMGQGGMGNPNYYMDDDDVPARNAANTKQVVANTREQGRFGRALSGARSGLNKLGGTALGMGALTAATGWAVGKIYEFGDACVELYNTNKEMKAKRDEIQAQGNKTIEDKYGYEAAYWAKQKDIAFNAMQDELNSLFYVNEAKVNRLQKEMDAASEKMKEAVKKNKERKETVVDNKTYMEMLAPKIELPPQNQSFNINIIGGEKAVVETSGKGVKPPTVKVKNTPSLGK